VKRGKFNEFTDETFVADSALIAKIRTAAVLHDRAKAAIVKAEREFESPKVLEVESENRRLKAELEGALETVDILKSILSK
jgi:hypothetical protein